ARPIVRLATGAAAGEPTTFAVAYDGFASHELVSLWYHRPDGVVVGLGEVRVDGQGQLAYSLAATSLASGRYILVAHGHCSRASAGGPGVVAAPSPAARARVLSSRGTR